MFNDDVAGTCGQRVKVSFYISTHVLVCLLQQQRTQIGSSSLSADIIIIDFAAVGLLLRRMATTTKFGPENKNFFSARGQEVE